VVGAMKGITANVFGLYAGWDFSTKAHKTHKCSALHKCSLKALLPTLRKTLVSRMCFIIHKFFNLKTNIK